MASSPPDGNDRHARATAAPASARAFAFQELHACWSQAYEAMTRGDLQGVESLLDEADRQLAAIDETPDTTEEAALRNQAFTAYATLRHAMQSGLEGLDDELRRTRKGARALRGYGRSGLRVGEGVTKHA